MDNPSGNRFKKKKWSETLNLDVERGEKKQKYEVGVITAFYGFCAITFHFFKFFLNCYSELLNKKKEKK